MAIERRPSAKKSVEIEITAEVFSSSFVRLKLTTALKSIIATASFVMPSPNKREKSFGCFSGLIRETAAMTSVAQSRLHMIKISAFDNSKMLLCPVSPLIYVMLSVKTSVYRIVRPEKLMKQIKVPTKPNSIILPKFSKNFFLCMLKPLAKTIGGKQK